MKFDLGNPQIALSHVVLADRDLAVQISKTTLWQSEGALEAKLIVNGIEVPAKLLEDVMQDLYRRCEKQIEDKYGKPNIDLMVEERAEEILKQHADNALEKINKIVESLENVGDVIKPYWER